MADGSSHPMVVRLGRSRRLLPLWVAQATGYLGEVTLGTALLWEMLRMTQSPLGMAAVLMAQQVPLLLVGILGPGRSLRPLPLLAVGRGLAALVLMAGLGLPPGFRPAWMVAAAFAEGLLAARVVPLLQTAVVEAVPAEDLGAANAWMELSSRLARLAAPLLAGVLLAGRGILPALLAVVASFGAAALATGRFLAQLDLPPVPPVPAGSGTSGLRQGIGAINGHPWLRTALLVRGVVNFLWPTFSLGLPLLVAHRWHQGPFVYGALLAVYGLANLCGTLLIGGLGDRTQAAYYPAWLATGAGFLLIAWAPTATWAFPGAFLLGMAGPAIHMALDTYIGRELPRTDIGRVYALQRLVMGGLSLLGTGCTGLLEAGSHGATLLAGSGVLLCLIAAPGAWRGMVWEKPGRAAGG